MGLGEESELEGENLLQQVIANYNEYYVNKQVSIKFVTSCSLSGLPEMLSGHFIYADRKVILWLIAGNHTFHVFHHFH